MSAPEPTKRQRLASLLGQLETAYGQRVYVNARIRKLETEVQNLMEEPDEPR